MNAQTQTDRLVATAKKHEPPASVTTAADPGVLPYHPDPPVMSFEAYGVKLEFCEEGDVIAEGHHSTRRFVAAANKVARRELGLANILDDHPSPFYADVAEGVRSVWAIRLPKCDCSAENLAKWGCDQDHDTDSEPSYWRISWRHLGMAFTAETPGARPYTIGSW